LNKIENRFSCNQKSQKGKNCQRTKFLNNNKANFALAFSKNNFNLFQTIF